MARKTPIARARLRAATVDPARSLAYAGAREAVHDRAGGRCEICGCRTPLPAGHAHHRRRRSAGRSDCPSNLLWLCAADHRLVHAQITASLRSGHLIGRHDHREPHMIPVQLRDGWYLLAADGTRIHLPGWVPAE